MHFLWKRTGSRSPYSGYPSGALVSLLGPSGCGKSSTLFTIVGLLKLMSGNIRFDRAVVNQVKTEQREIGMVFQNYSLYPHMTAFENIHFPLTTKKWTKADKIKRIYDIAALLHITNYLNHKPSQLSGGQQQRVATARDL